MPEESNSQRPAVSCYHAPLRMFFWDFYMCDTACAFICYVMLRGWAPGAERPLSIWINVTFCFKVLFFYILLTNQVEDCYHWTCLDHMCSDWKLYQLRRRSPEVVAMENVNVSYNCFPVLEGRQGRPDLTDAASDAENVSHADVWTFWRSDDERFEVFTLMIPNDVFGQETCALAWEGRFS